MNTGSRYVELMVSKAIKTSADGHLREAYSLLMDLLPMAGEEPQIHYHLGMICTELGRNMEALEHYRTLMQLAPDFLEGRMLLGMACAEMGHHEESISHLRQVLQTCPNVPEVRYRIALSLAELHQHQESFDEYQKLLSLAPDHDGALCGLGMLFISIGQIKKAREYLLRAHGRDKCALNIINNLAKVYRAGHIEDAIQWYKLGLAIDQNHDIIVSNYLYALNCVPDLSPEFIAKQYLHYAPRAFPTPPKSTASKLINKPHNLKIRVGYVSADFYAHSVAFFLEPILEHHDRQRFEIYCYSNRTVNDEVTQRIASLCDHWRTIVGVSSDDAAELISEDEIDILVDLSGHTAGRRLDVFARRPAPIQVSWIGHPNTTGLPQMDYYLTDSWCDPPGMTDQFYSETLYRLPRVFSCYKPAHDAPLPEPVPSSKTGVITFGCFNQLKKINVPLISWWVRILEQIPGSQLLIKSPNLNDPVIQQEILECFTSQGGDQQRIFLRGVTQTRQEHLALYNQIDIALDTYPYHGTTTTCEALWMGIPVVTLAGSSHVSRVGVSFLHSIGKEELVAQTPEEYIATAVNLARNPAYLHELRSTLRTIMLQSPLMDATGITRDVEKAYLSFVHDCKERNIRATPA